LSWNFPQAPKERLIYMQILRGIVIGAPGDWVLSVKKSIYCKKQAKRLSHEHFVKKLTSPALLYTDDSILASPDERELDRRLGQLVWIYGVRRTRGLLGVKSFHLVQPQLFARLPS
jgi:hypothetical protein